MASTDQPLQKVMPEQKWQSEEEESTDVEELSTASTRREEVVHHPNAVTDDFCFDNGAFDSYNEETTAKIKESLKNPIFLLDSKDLSHSENFSDPELSMEENIPTLQTLSLPEDQKWMETDRNDFISKKIQSIVQAFHYRTEKAKEKLVQPPTPSPSPPLETSSDNDQTTPIHQSRPRLQSLIEDEKSSTGSVNINLYCCIIKKKFLPAFPQIIDPQSKLYIIWLFFVMLSYSYNAWAIIFRAVFPYQTPENLPIFLTFDYLSDVIYILDIALFKVRLQFLHNGFWVENFKQTKANYFRKREFKLDLLSLLPLDLLYFAYGYNPLFRLPRFFKVQTFWEFFNRVDAVTKTPYVIRIIRTLMYMMYLIHLNACAYYAMSTWEGIGSNRWVFQGVGNAYIRCFYFATKTATSIGKNPKPENEIEYIFMTISWLMGVFIFAFLVGQIRDIVATATQSRTQYRQLMDQTVMYMRNLNLPDELQRRVRMWLNHNWEQQKTFNVSKILDTLPRKMKTDVAINVHYKTLVKVQLFKDCDKALLRDLVLQLRPVLFLPGDYICRKGEVGKEMYIVNKGIVEVLGGNQGDVVLATLAKGSVFGEISLLGIPGCNRRTADVRSKGFSNLFVLSKDDLWEALKNYPEAQKVLKKKAKNIIKENEARARATKAETTESGPSTDSPKEGRGPSYTPKLVRTVLQVLPRSYHRIQPQPSTSFAPKSTFTPIEPPPRTTPPDLTPHKPSLKNHRVQSATPSPKPPIAPSHRSLSAGTLRHPKTPFAPKKISPTKSEPCNSYLRLTDPDPPTQRSDSGSDSDPNSRTDNEVFVSEDSSEASSTSTQRMVIEDNSDLEDAPEVSSSSSTPYLGALFDFGSSQSSFKSSSRDIQMVPLDLKPPPKPSFSKVEVNKSSSTPSSNSSSLLYLGGLFRHGSSQSFNSSNKEYPLSPMQDIEDGDSTNESSSAGYDNLAFVPTGILSRRSSIFSDTSG